MRNCQINPVTRVTLHVSLSKVVFLKHVTDRMSVHSIKYIKGWKFVSVSLSHYRTLALALLLTHVITKKSYEMDCAS